MKYGRYNLDVHRGSAYVVGRVAAVAEGQNVSSSSCPDRSSWGVGYHGLAG